MPPTVEDRLEKKALSFYDPSVLLAAIELDLFTAVGRKGGTLEEISSHLGVAPRRLGSLLDVLVHLGYLRVRGERYLLTSLTARCNRSHPNACADRLAFFPSMMSGWTQIAQVIRSDRPLQMETPGTPSDPDQMRTFHTTLAIRGQPAARELAQRLARRDMKEIADLGGGLGIYLRALLARAPRARGVLVERAPVAELARERLSGSGVEDRVEIRTVDFQREPFGGPYDLILISNILHAYGESDAREILSRAHAALAPRGRIAVKDLALATNRRGPRRGVLFRLTMALFTPEGDAHPTARIASWLRELGLTGVRSFRLRRAPESVVVTGLRAAVAG